MKSETTAVDGARWAALYDVMYDVRSLFIELYCFQPTDRELKALLRAEHCRRDLRYRQTWQELHALLLAQRQALRQERQASQRHWEAKAKSWKRWLAEFQQSFQARAFVRERCGQEARQIESQSWQVLELDPNTATAIEIKHAYRRLALEHHPDRGGCAEHFREIHQAYEWLMAAVR